MFELQKHCDALVDLARKSNLARTFLSQVEGALLYLKQQTSCDLDRRDNAQTLRSRWLAFETLIKPTPLHAAFQSDKRRWRALQQFAGVPLIDLCPEPARPPKPKSKFEGKEAKDILQFLFHETSRLKLLSDLELTVLRIGLMYLAMAADKARSQRNPKDMEYVWRSIHPIMHRVGLLNVFHGEPDAARKVKNCIKDRPF